MEFLPNGDLQKQLSCPLSESEGQRIALQLAEGLMFMHENDFVHRDLKPAVSVHFLPMTQKDLADLTQEHPGQAYRSLLVGQNC